MIVWSVVHQNFFLYQMIEHQEKEKRKGLKILKNSSKVIASSFFVFFFFAISWASPAAHGDSQARG